MSSASTGSYEPPLASQPKNWFPLTRQFLVRSKEELTLFCWATGDLWLTTVRLARYIKEGKLSWKHLSQQASFIGIDTLGICLIMNTFTGMVIALQVASEMVKQGAGNYVGALVSLAMLRELAPIMTGFSVIAMAGSAYAAELSTMQITNQVDALKVLHVDPVRYLILPRVVACILALPLMTIITGYAGILGGLFITGAMTDLHPETYLDSVWNQTEVKDVFACLTKASVFGYLIAMIATTVGLNATGGSKEVGLATTRAVVWSFVMMAIFDYLLTYLFYGSK